MENIIVSIIMPTFNRANLINKAIESIINQNFKEWELLIIDNESTDDTKEVLNNYLTDDRIKYFFVRKNKDSGISEYLNYGISIAKGKYIARLDDDDEWNDIDKLNKQVIFLENNSEYVAVGGGGVMINEKRKEIFKFLKRETDAEIRNNALLANPICHNTVMFRKEIALKLGGYKKIKYVEDWDLWLRMGKEGKLYNFKEYMLKYMNAGQNLSTSNPREAGKIILSLIKKYRNEYPHFKKAFVLNYMQYLFSFFPLLFRQRIQNFLFYVKRNYF